MAVWRRRRPRRRCDSGVSKTSRHDVCSGAVRELTHNVASEGLEGAIACGRTVERRALLKWLTR